MYAERSLIQKIPLFWAIIPVYFVIFEVVFSMNYYIILNDEEEFSLKILSLIIFEPLAILTIITHIKSMITPPGFVPIPFKSPFASSKLPSDSRKQETNSQTFCKKCNNPRPPRAHHCKICGKCVLKMDHHCPWIANCVGYYNQKNFYQFLFYATTGDFFGFVFLTWKFMITDTSIKGNVPKGAKIKSALDLIYYMWTPIQIVIGLLCALAMTVSIGVLFYKQTHMLLNNQTTIEKKMYEDWENGPFYEPNKIKSFNSVMGNTIGDWFSLKFDGNDPYLIEKTQAYYDMENI